MKIREHLQCKPFLACLRHGRCWKHSEWAPGPGVFAYCGHGMLGLITSDVMEVVEYPDGTSGLAWTGIHLSEGMEGKPWSSRRPDVVGATWELRSKNKSSI